jgi:uncharacterized membrane protein YeaQ/YmgE (transglycosylase-associated protein family)
MALNIAIEYALLGMLGALAGYLIKTWKAEGKFKLVLPKIGEDGAFYPGILAYLILGAIAGWLVPEYLGSDSISSFFAGFTFMEFYDVVGSKVSFSSRTE